MTLLPLLRRAAGALGTVLGRAARRLGIGKPAARAAVTALRRLEPGHPLITRAEAAERTRALREACADDASRASLDEFLTRRTYHLSGAYDPVTNTYRLRRPLGPDTSEGDTSL